MIAIGKKLFLRRIVIVGALLFALPLAVIAIVADSRASEDRNYRITTTSKTSTRWANDRSLTCLVFPDHGAVNRANIELTSRCNRNQSSAQHIPTN